MKRKRLPSLKHAWVIDGLLGDYYHINWGWHGKSDGYYKSEDYYTRNRFHGATGLCHTDSSFRFSFSRAISNKCRTYTIYVNIYSNLPLKENIRYQLFQYDLTDLARFLYYDSNLDKLVDITAYSGSVEFTDIIRDESYPIGLSGKFEFQAINPITKDTVYVTDGAFENVRFEFNN